MDGHSAGLCGLAGLLPAVMTLGTMEANLSSFYHHREKRYHSDPELEEAWVPVGGRGHDTLDRNRFARGEKSAKVGPDTLPEIPSGPKGDKEFDTDSNPLGDH